MALERQLLGSAARLTGEWVGGVHLAFDKPADHGANAELELQAACDHSLVLFGCEVDSIEFEFHEC